MYSWTEPDEVVRYVLPPNPVGLPVRYVLPGTKGECRPAIIVKVWNRIDGKCNLSVFSDIDDIAFGNIVAVREVPYSPAKLPGTWHHAEYNELPAL